MALKVHRRFRTEKFTSEFPTRAEGGVEKVVKALQAEHGFSSWHISELYSEWSLSDSDHWFITDELKHVKIAWSYSRPQSEEGWPEAIRQASIALHGLRPVDQLLPVLSDPGPFDELVVCRKLDRWSFRLGEVTLRDNGGIGVGWPMQAELDANAIAAKWAAALANLQRGLRTNVGELRGETVATFTHGHHVGASAWLLPELVTQVAKSLRYVDVVAVANRYDTLWLVEHNGRAMASLLEQSSNNELSVPFMARVAR